MLQSNKERSYPGRILWNAIKDSHPLWILSILGSGSGDWSKVFAAIKEPLGLELIKEGKQTKWGYIGPYWAITKWNNLKIDNPVYRKPSEYIPYDKVNEVWKEFAINKEGISSNLKTGISSKL